MLRGERQPFDIESPFHVEYSRFEEADEPLVVQANYAEPDPEPPKRLENDVPASTPKEDAVRAVIDRLLNDHSAEEREIWFEELKGVPPGIVEDLLGVRRQLGSAKPRTPLEAKPDEPARVSQPREPSRPCLEWETAIRAMHQARAVHLHNLANVYSPGYKRQVPVFAPLAVPTDASKPGERQWGSEWQGVRQDDPGGVVNPDDEWRAIERIDLWLEAVSR